MHSTTSCYLWKFSLLPRELGRSQKKLGCWMPGINFWIPPQNGDSEQKGHTGKVKLISCTSELVEWGSYSLHMEASFRFGKSPPAANIHTVGWLQTVEIQPDLVEATCLTVGEPLDGEEVDSQKSLRILEIEVVCDEAELEKARENVLNPLGR